MLQSLSLERIQFLLLGAADEIKSLMRHYKACRGRFLKSWPVALLWQDVAGCGRHFMQICLAKNSNSRLYIDACRVTLCSLSPAGVNIMIILFLLGRWLCHKHDSGQQRINYLHD